MRVVSVKPLFFLHNLNFFLAFFRKNVLIYGHSAPCLMVKALSVINFRARTFRKYMLVGQYWVVEATGLEAGPAYRTDYR